jgi:uncharacterized membrane protein HdeD (DUF308 family)
VEQTAVERRAAWGRKHGWVLFGLLGVALLAFGLWALSEDRPALAGVPTAMGAGFLGVALYLFVRRDRR